MPSRCLVNKGLEFKRGGNLEQAFACFDQAIEEKHDLARAYYSKGWALHELDKFVEAEDCYHKSLTENPDYRFALGSMGLLMQRTERVSEALEFFNKILENYPDDWTSLYHRSNALMDLNRPQEVGNDLVRAMEIMPDTTDEETESNVITAFARHSEMSGNVEQALESYTDGVNIFSTNIYALNGVARMLDHKGEYEEALELVNKVSEIDANDLAAKQTKGCILIHQHKVEEALPYLKDVVKARPDNFESHYNLSCAYACLKMNAAAISSLKSALDIFPDLVNHVEGDPELENIRHEPGYKALIESALVGTI